METKTYAKTTEKNFLIGLSIILICATIYLTKDIFSILITSLILAHFLEPLYKFILKKINNPQISSLLTLFATTILIFTPLTLITYFVILSLIKLVLKYKQYITNPEILNAQISQIISSITNSPTLNSINYSDFVSELVKFILEFAKNTISAIPILVGYFFIILFITYYILIHKEQVIKGIGSLTPLSESKQKKILAKIAKNTDVLFKGYFLTGLVQTIIAFLGYLIFGAPSLLIITFLTMITSLIPYLGTPLIWVPVSLYLILIGETFNGIGLLIYGTLIINLVDNFLRPHLMSTKDTLPPALVFIGFIGGLLAFGLIGLIIGPLLISVTAIILQFLQETYLELKNQKN